MRYIFSIVFLVCYINACFSTGLRLSFLQSRKDYQPNIVFKDAAIEDLRCFAVVENVQQKQVLLGGDLFQAEFLRLGKLVSKDAWLLFSVSVENIILQKENLTKEINCYD